MSSELTLREFMGRVGPLVALLRESKRFFVAFWTLIVVIMYTRYTEYTYKLFGKLRNISRVITYPFLSPIISPTVSADNIDHESRVGF